MNNKLKGQLPPELAAYQELIEKTITSYIEIIPTANKNTNWWQSKFGGLPYLPKGIQYPKTSKGNYLFLLAQINFAEVPHLENFPRQGILQFYIADDDLYGINLQQLNQQEGFRIMYFSEPDLKGENLITNFEFLPNTESLPFSQNFSASLEFNLKTAPLTVFDYRFENIFAQFFDSLDEEACYDLCDLYQSYYEQYYSDSGHRIGGYPNFTQDDPRNSSFVYDILLLQIDSMMDLDRELEIMWGDMGVGNFFIKESALKNLDFTDVIYNYDCC